MLLETPASGSALAALGFTNLEKKKKALAYHDTDRQVACPVARRSHGSA